MEMLSNLIPRANPAPPILRGASKTEMAIDWECPEDASVKNYVVEISGPIESDDSDGPTEARWVRKAKKKTKKAIITGCDANSFYKVRVVAETQAGSYYSFPGATATNGFKTDEESPVHTESVGRLERHIYEACIAAEAAYSDNSQLYIRSIARKHNLSLDFIVDDCVTLFSTTDKTVSYVTFRGAVTPFYHQEVQPRVLRRILEIVEPRTTLAELYFVGYDNGGRMAVKALVDVLLAKNVLPGVFMGCITFGAPLTLALDYPEALQHQHLFFHVVHAKDPVPFQPLLPKPADWAAEFNKAIRPCPCSGVHFMDVPLHNADKVFTYQTSMIASLLKSMSAQLATQSSAFAEDPGAFFVLGNVKFICTGYDNTATDVTSFLASHPAFAVEDLECHMPLHYAKVIDPPPPEDDERDVYAPFCTPAIKLGPEISSDYTYISLFGDFLEASVYGKNLKYTRAVTLNLPDGGGSHQLAIVEVHMQKVRARIPVADLGLINNTMELELEVMNDFACRVLEGVRCVEHIDLRPVPKWADQFSDLPLTQLFSCALRFALLRSDGKWTCTKLHKSLYRLEEITSFIGEHNRQWLSRLMMLPLGQMDVQETHVIRDMFDEGMIGSLCDEDLYQKSLEHVVNVVRALQSEIKFSLSDRRSDTSYGVFIAKVAAVVGGVAVLMTPPGQIALAGAATGEVILAATAGAQAIDVIKHIVSCQASYKDKLLFLIHTLGMQESRVPSEAYYYELLIHGKLQGVFTEDELHGSMKVFEDAGLEKWDQLSSEDSWIHGCNKEDRKTLIRLLWSVQNIYLVRKTLTDTFIVQIFGQTDAGKTTLVKNVFGISSARPGSMVKDVTTLKSGYRVNYSDQLIVVDNPGIVDSTGRGEAVLNHASYYLVVVHWDGGMRAVPFIMRMAEIQTSSIPFKLVITKCDTMTMSGWKKAQIKQWLGEHLGLLNDILTDCRKFLSHETDVQISDSLKEALTRSTVFNEFGLGQGVEEIGKTPITADDCILSCISANDDREVAHLREVKCKAASVSMVADVREQLMTTWGADYGFQLTFPATSPQDEFSDVVEE